MLKAILFKCRFFDFNCIRSSNQSLRFFLLFVFVFSSLISCTQEKTTRYDLTRHKEKDRIDKTNKNPNLNEKGFNKIKIINNYCIIFFCFFWR